MLRKFVKTASRAAGNVPLDLNEPMFDYAPGSAERAALYETVAKVHSTTKDIPLIIGGEEIYDAPVRNQVSPYDHQNVIAKYRIAGEEHLNAAIDSAMSARKAWDRVPVEDRVQIFLKAADLLAGEHRKDICATTMAGQAKNAWQAEIDSAPELIDFFRFNAHYALELQKSQPISPSPEILTNHIEYRGLEGFVAAIAPFNFTAISGNLAGTPAMMGNVVLWKPSDTAVLSSYLIYEILVKCGLPKEVIQFVPADGPTFGKTITASPDLAAINFTGSVPTFEWLWKAVGNNISNYKGFPVMVGECGGKNSHFFHPSGDVGSMVAGTIRSAFEYSGQKCSACSRCYVPKSKWAEIKSGLLNIHKDIVVGRADEPATFVSAVIDETSFDRCAKWIDIAHSDPELTVIAGGTYDKSKGYFIQPTMIESSNPENPILSTEIFGPIVAFYVYDDADWKSVASSIGETSPYSLTGGIYCKDEADKAWLIDELRESAGNFYVNDKSTGSVVGQQWFGGARKSGTNDKAGGPGYVAKWTSPQAVKTTKIDQHAWRYPSMDE